jgi:glycosyltransferase involved in cell wall biosynthesis
LRSGLLAAALVERGHQVTWWATTFQHSSKSQRAQRDTAVEIAPGYRILLMRTPGYSANVSLARYRDHRALGRSLRDWMRREQAPDVIHCGLPTIETAYEATRYGQERNVPCVIDARDMWPDIYLETVPALLRPLLRVALAADMRMAREALHDADAISGHAPGFVEWGLQRAGRPRNALDQDFPFSYPAHVPSPQAVADAQRFWRGAGLTGSADEFVVCFFGAFAERKEVDLQTVLTAAAKLQQAQPRIKFVLCGAGPAAQHYATLARGLSNVLLPGWMDFPRIWTLMRQARVGLLPYVPSRDFLASMPNKSIEYLSAGLPVLTSLGGGYLHEVLEQHGCGIFYRPRDPDSLAAVLGRTLAEPLALETKRAAAAALFQRRFEPGRVYSDMVDHLQRVAATRRHDS